MRIVVCGAGTAGCVAAAGSPRTRGRMVLLEGLWVIDASVIPRVPSANTHLAVIALAERLAAAFRAAGGGAGASAPGRGAT